MTELQKSMDLCKVKATLEGELRRLENIQYCIEKRYTDVSTINGLDLSMNNLKKCLELLK